MSDTYTQIHIHLVFAVKYRKALIHRDWKDELFKYITGIIQSKQHRVLAINGMPDHIHIFFGMRPAQALSELVKDIKSSSSRWINESKCITERFAWQEGFAAFSYSKSHVANVISYVMNQEAHHAKVTFLDEYEELLRKFEIQYKKEYLFRPLG